MTIIVRLVSRMANLVVRSLHGDRVQLRSTSAGELVQSAEIPSGGV